MPTIPNAPQNAIQDIPQNIIPNAPQDLLQNPTQNPLQSQPKSAIMADVSSDYFIDESSVGHIETTLNANGLLDSATAKPSDLAGDFASQHAFFGVFVLFALTFVAFNYTLKIQRFISRKIATKTRDKLKLAPYECGPTPLKQPAKIPLQFFIIALLFVLFDIEVVFMIPWAIIYKEVINSGGSGFGILLFIEMISFILLLVVGLVYAWKKGALQWNSHANSHNASKA